MAITDRSFVDELTLLLFTSWLFGSYLNATDDKARLNLIPHSGGNQTALVISPERSLHAAPGRGDIPRFIDLKYMECHLDGNGGQVPKKQLRRTCPVLNRIRASPGASDGAAMTPAIGPPSSRACCDSSKAALHLYLGALQKRDPVALGRAYGGTAFVYDLEFEKVCDYVGRKLAFDTSHVGRLLEELLMIIAGERAEVMFGTPHLEITRPFLANEIDFALWSTNGKKELSETAADSMSDAEWKAWASDTSLICFELTVGHKLGKPSSMSDDHPRNKLANYLALRRIRLANFRFHYLAISPGEFLADSVRYALADVGQDFGYWCLDTVFPNIRVAVLNHLDQPVAPSTVRDWHKALVDHVEQCAHDFGAACGEQRFTPIN